MMLYIYIYIYMCVYVYVYVCVCVCVCARARVCVCVCVYISAVKQLIVINRIQNKSFCLHNICLCTVFIYYVCIYKCTHIQYIFGKYLHVYAFYIFILYFILYMNVYITYKQHIFLKFIHACVCIYIWIIHWDAINCN